MYRMSKSILCFFSQDRDCHTVSKINGEKKTKVKTTITTTNSVLVIFFLLLVFIFDFLLAGGSLCSLHTTLFISEMLICRHAVSKFDSSTVLCLIRMSVGRYFRIKFLSNNAYDLNKQTMNNQRGPRQQQQATKNSSANKHFALRIKL